jgi:hypothetical protein
VKEMKKIVVVVKSGLTQDIRCASSGPPVLVEVHDYDVQEEGPRVHHDKNGDPYFVNTYRCGKWPAKRRK